MKHVIKLRRDMQRLALMLRGDAVESSPSLDKKWIDTGANSQALKKLIKDIGVGRLLTNKQINLLDPFLKYADWRWSQNE